MAANAFLPALGAIICPVISSQTVAGAETLNTSCDVQDGGSIEIIADTGSLTANKDLSIKTGGQVINSGTLYNQDGATLSNAGMLTNNNSSTLVNQVNGILSNTSGATLFNDGALENNGLVLNTGIIDNAGSITGTGKFNNTGALNIEEDGSVSIAHSDNLVGGSLSGGGSWNFVAGSGTASLAFGSGSTAITTLDVGTSVTLSGAGAQFPQLEKNLTGLNGTLEVRGHDIAIAPGGILNIGNQGQLNSLNSSFSNAGSLTITGAFYNNGGSTFTNKAGGSLLTGGTLTNDGAVNNSGTVGIEKTGSIQGTGVFTQTGGVALVNGLLRQPTIDIQGGRFTGAGTVRGNITIGSVGILSPGSTHGKLTVDGGLNLNGTLMIGIAGTAADSYDLLDVYNGVVNFGVGSLIAINLDNLLNPRSGMMWDFLLSDNPFFGLNNAKYQVNGLDPSLAYEFRSVNVDGRHALEFVIPEPDSLALFGMGGVLLAFRRRRQGI